MPELPEVQTTVNGINATVRGRTIVDVWTDYPIRKRLHSASNGAGRVHKDSVKNTSFFKDFKKKVAGEKILRAERRAKNILIHLSGDHTVLIHMKMTGHVLYGEYEKKNNKWVATKDKKLQDPFNQFIRFVFVLDNGKNLVLSDMRRFAKVTIINTKDLDKSMHLENIGPEPLENSFTYLKFKERLLKKSKSKIKTTLMDPSVIAGIGNIYSDEILWRAGVHPVSIVGKIPEKNLKLMFTAMKQTLMKGIDFGGDSMSDYRNIKGERGDFQNHHEAYRRTGKKCSRDKGVIKRLVVGGRSAHFCPIHQVLYN